MQHNTLEDAEEYVLRKRFRDHSPDDSLEAGELSDALSEDEDAPGCPLPSTPEDTELLEAEVIICYHTFRHFADPLTFLIVFNLYVQSSMYIDG